MCGRGGGCVCVLVAQLCLTLCYPMDCNLPDSSVYGILQARVLEWVAIAFSLFGGLDVKESDNNVGDAGLIPGFGKILWRRK